MLLVVLALRTCVAEPFVDHSRIDATYFGPETVAAGTVFVLGDDRAVSIDSRDFGAIPVTSIEGIVLTAVTAVTAVRAVN